MATSRTPSSAPLSPLTLAVEPAAPGAQPTSAGSLLDRLAQALAAHEVSYCQWKGHWSAHRWATGHGDVDLLVDARAIGQFRSILAGLGFKLAHPNGGKQIVGIESYFGHDESVPRLLHLHVHYRLLLGDYWKPVYRIPLESGLLGVTVPGQPFRIPSPTYQYLVFVLRMMLRQVGRPLLSARTHWVHGIQIQLGSLEAGSDRDELASILRQHLSTLDVPLIERCARSLQGECGPIERALLPWRLHRRLRSHARHPSVGAVLSAAAEKFLPDPIARLIIPGGMRLAQGGKVVALIGGDGAGKSTCARELAHWLAPAFPTMRAHLGNPPRAFLTLLVGGALKLQNGLDRLLGRASSPSSVLELLRHVCTARDRFLLYRRVQQFAVAGGVAVCERYPIEQNRLLVGPCIPGLVSRRSGRVASLLRRAEASYYARILSPDVVCVLRLDPELAVIRKPEEPADYVRSRGRVIWETDWSSTGAHLVDASQPFPEVLHHLKAIVWSAL